MSQGTCDILMPRFDTSCGPHDANGCHLPRGHHEPHEFVATNGRTYQWQTDWECSCESCREVELDGDGDYCITYSEKP